MKKKIILVGGGGHCKSVIDVIESTEYSILGILDVPSKIGTQVLSSEIIGSDEDIEKYIDEALFLITVGFVKNCKLRVDLFNRIEKAGGKFATIISPLAYVSKHAKVGRGTIIMHKAVVNAEVSIGDNCIINTMANVEHEVKLGNNTHISTGAVVNGGSVIGNENFIGSQVVIAQSITILNNCIIGSNSFVNRNLTEPGTYIGTPVQKI